MGNARLKKLPSSTILAVAALFLVVVSVWSIGLSPYFRVTDVVVKGNYFCPQNFLSEVLNPTRLGNILSLHTGALRQRLEDNPWISSAQVKRVLPSTIEVTITETYPVAALAVGEGFVLISPEGLAIQTVQQISKFGVPVLTTDLPAPITEGERVNLPYLSETAKAIGELQCSGVPVTIGQVNLSADNQMTLYCSGGLKISWGDLQDFDHKLQLLLVIINEEGGDLGHIAHISLTNGNDPGVLYKLN